MATSTTERGAETLSMETTQVSQLDGKGLIRVGARPSLGQYLKDLWAFRSFIIYDSHSRVASANTGDSLGRVWMVLNPLLLGMAFLLVFGVLLGTSRGVVNFIGYLVIGIFMFRFFTASLSASASSISGNQNVVQAFNFPRACLPLATALRQVLANVPVFVVMALLAYFMGDMTIGDSAPEPITLTWHWLLFFPCLLLTVMVMTGIGLILARATNAYNDVKHLVTFSTRILMYASAVFFTVDRWADSGYPWLIELMYLNPLYCTLDIIRHAWIYDGFADPQRWIVLASWAFGSMIIGFIIFWQGEETYGRER